MASHIGYITIDCTAPDSLASFWCAVLDYEKQHVDEEWVRIGAPGATELQLLFQRVPEDKMTKNRLHFDLVTSDLDAEVERLRGLGARYLEPHAERGMQWVVMADPEANEFCVVQTE